MTKTTNVILMMTVLTLAHASSAVAQGEPGARFFFNLNGAGQNQSQMLETGVKTFPIYGGTATWGTAQGMESGSVFDISAGGRVWRQVFVGLGYAKMEDTTNEIAGNASIPDPLIFNRLRPLTFTNEAVHTERSVYLQVLWIQPIWRGIEAAASIGPSWFRTQQDFMVPLTAANFTEPGTGQTPSVSRTIVTEIESKAAGVNAGIDLSYIYRYVGAGFFLRYNGATVDFPSFPDFKVGGFQYGGGLRVRF
jgi:hypothetical protein